MVISTYIQALPMPTARSAFAYAFRGLSYNGPDKPPSYSSASDSSISTKEALQHALHVKDNTGSAATIDKQSAQQALFAQQAMTTLQVAQDAYDQGNVDFANEMYMTAINMLIRALPAGYQKCALSELDKDALRRTLLSASDRVQLGLVDAIGVRQAVDDALASYAAQNPVGTVAEGSGALADSNPRSSMIGNLLVKCIRGAAVAARSALPTIQQGLALEQEHRIIERTLLLIVAALSKSANQVNRLPISYLLDSILEGLVRGVDEAQKVFNEAACPPKESNTATDTSQQRHQP
ncbi:hypothetical protein PYCC9005_002134 [Savitreella phatthalungensis]